MMIEKIYASQNYVNEALANKLSYNEQTLTPEQQEQVRKNIGVVQADYAQNDITAADYIKNRLAYTETNILTYDGNPEIRSETSDEGIYTVKVSNELIDLNSIKKVIVQPENGEQIVVEVTPDIMQVEMPTDYTTFLLISYEGMQVPVMVAINFPANTEFAERNGTYLCGYENEIMVGYISCVEYGESIIHKLDPKYLPEGGFGYTERGTKTIKWDGNTDGKTVVSSGGLYSFVNITSEPIKPESIKHIVFGDPDNSEVLEYFDDEIMVIEKSSGIYFIQITEGGIPLLVICESAYSIEDEILPRGVNLVTNTVHHTKLVEYDDETIHIIDPKYLPEVEAVEPDWTENDESASGYIKNRPFYDGEKTLKLTQGEIVNAPFTKNDLIGLKVVDKHENRWLLKTPSKRLAKLDDENSDVSIFYCGNQAMSVVYTNVNGALSKNCLVVSFEDNDGLGRCCPILYNTDYDSLLYVYEETTDNIGVGLTFEEGWYAINKTTYNHTPIEINNNFILSHYIFADGTIYEKEYFKECFTNDGISYTISENNIYMLGDERYITYMDVSSVRNSSIGNLIALTYNSFIYYPLDNTLEIRENLSDAIAEEVLISYPYLKQIDPKFIPATLITDSEADALIASII